MRRAVLPILFFAGTCAMSDVPADVPAANGAMWGTDAHLTPSQADAVLRYADHPRGFGELRLPAGKSPFPLAVIFHGGCFKTGVADQAYMAPLATRWQQLGIATLNVDYREVGDGGGWPASFVDWDAADELVRQLVSRDRRIDGARVTYVGHSAGALPAQWLAQSQGEDGPVGPRDLPLVADAIVFDGPADLIRDRAPFDALCQFSAIEQFIGGTVDEVRERYAALSPLRHPPRLGRVAFVQARLPAPDAEAVAALRVSGVRVTVETHPEASHFDIITPGSPTYAAIEPRLIAILKRP